MDIEYWIANLAGQKILDSFEKQSKTVDMIDTENIGSIRHSGQTPDPWPELNLLRVT